ncbi:MAG: PD-(D/E)XK nuclease family protein [Acholeplasmatales bacterium]|nr:PD-(D/E)XK nuclease family protein [Acholeplasmatales bacterium]
MIKITPSFISLHNSALIVPRYLQKEIVRQKNQFGLINCKIIVEEDFCTSLELKYQEDAVLYLMQNYHYSFWKAQAILKAMSKYFITDRSTHNPLEDLRDELIKLNFFQIPHNIYYESLKNKKVWVFNDYSVLNLVLNHYQITPHYLKIEFDFHPQVTYSEFDNIDFELGYVFNEIAKKIKGGTDINHLKIFCNNTNYFYYLKRYERLFKIPLLFPNQKLGNYYLITNFLHELEEKDFDQLLNDYKQRFPLKSEQIALNLLDKIIIPQYRNFPKDELINIIKYLAEKTSFNPINYYNCLEVIDEIIVDGELQIFFLSFNHLIPTTTSPLEFINSDLLSFYGLDNYHLENLRTIKNYEIFLRLKNIQTLTLTKYLAGREYFASLLVDLLAIQKVSVEIKEPFYSRSWLKYFALLANQRYLLYGLLKDQILAKKASPLLGDLASYQNSFQPWKNIGQIGRQNQKLSFSSLNTYNKCPFSYYLNYLLLPKKYQESFDLALGTTLHQIIQLYVNQHISLTEVAHLIDDFGQNTTYLSPRERSFLPRIKFQFQAYLQNLTNILHTPGYQDSHFEVAFLEKLRDNWSLSGSIDWLLKFQDTQKQNQHYELIIDFKSGNNDEVENLLKIKTGINQQLLIYLTARYLKTSTDDSTKPLGTFFSRIFPAKAYPIDLNTNYYQQVQNDWRLDGIAVDNLASLVDLNEVLRTRKTTSFTFTSDSANEGPLNIEEVCGQVLTMVEETMKKIAIGDFRIAPYFKSSFHQACSYCEHKNICYRKFENYRNIS